jgi:hypothetical protein
MSRMYEALKKAEHEQNGPSRPLIVTGSVNGRHTPDIQRDLDGFARLEYERIGVLMKTPTQFIWGVNHIGHAIAGGRGGVIGRTGADSERGVGGAVATEDLHGSVGVWVSRAPAVARSITVEGVSQ